MAILAYLRVSTDEQTVENQRLNITGNGFAVDKWFQDDGISGTKAALTRKGFKELMSVVKCGDTVICTEVSRLGRDTADVLLLVEKFKQLGVKLRILQLAGVDLTDAAGELIVSVMAAISSFERKTLITRTRMGIHRARTEGKVLGKPLKHTPEQLRTMQEQLSQGVKMVDVAHRNNVSERQLARYKSLWNCPVKMQEYVNKFVSQQKQLKGSV